jgi:hypothetical protein
VHGGAFFAKGFLGEINIGRLYSHIENRPIHALSMRKKAAFEFTPIIFLPIDAKKMRLSA